MDRPLALLAAAAACSFAPSQDFPLSNLPDNSRRQVESGTHKCRVFLPR